MTKQELETKTTAVIEATRNALQTVYSALNNGQRKKLLKDDAVAALLMRYGIVNEEVDD